MARQLHWEEGRWYSSAARGAVRFGEVEVELEAYWFPRPEWDECFWVARQHGHEASRYAGWGTLDEQVDSVFEVPAKVSAVETVLLLPVWAMCEALAPLSAAQSVSITGQGPVAQLLEASLIHCGMKFQPGPRSQCDLLVDSTGDPRVWEAALPSVAGEGTVVTFVPPWAKPYEFNFYPELHRRSLTLLARRWLPMRQNIESAKLENVTPAVAGLLAQMEEAA